MPAILLTRPAAGATRFADALRARLGAVAIVTAPVLRIEGTGARPDLSGDPVFIFTSVNGVAHCGVTGAGRRALCVGDATARAARDAGFKATSAGGDARDLLAMIATDPPRQPLLHLRGAHATGDLAAHLRKLGLRAGELVVYDQVAQPMTAQALALLDGDDPVIVPLFSPRSAREFGKQHQGRAPLDLIAISDATALEVADLPRRCMTVATEPHAQAMLDAICRRFTS